MLGHMWKHLETLVEKWQKKWKKSFSTRKGLETAHTCLYDIARCYDIIQHCDLSLKPNSRLNSGPKTSSFYRAW